MPASHQFGRSPNTPPRISRDGRFAAFLLDARRAGQHLRHPNGTGPFRNVTRGDVPEQLVNREIRTMQFSPTAPGVLLGGRVRHVERPRGISTWEVPTLGGEPRLALEGVPEIAWSADGRRLVYHTKGPGDPAFVKSEGSVAQPLYVAPVPKPPICRIWSPDGSFISFVRGYLPDEMDIWRNPSDGRLAGTNHLPRLADELSDVPQSFDALYLAADADGSGPSIYGLESSSGYAPAQLRRRAMNVADWEQRRAAGWFQPRPRSDRHCGACRFPRSPRKRRMPTESRCPPPRDAHRC